MEALLRVKDVACITGWSKDTARARMQEMSGVMNLGTAKRRQLAVKESTLADWLADRAMYKPEAPVIRPSGNSNGKMARRDRRTGELIRKKNGR